MQAQPVSEPQRHSNQRYNHVITTERETRRSVQVSGRGESLPDVESGEMGQRTDEGEWAEEEHLSDDQIPTEPEQEVSGLVTQRTSELPTDGHDPHPQTRRSTREKKPTQMLTYQTLGHPSYQPRTRCNAVEADRLPAVPAWELQSYPMTYHTPYTHTRCFHTSHHIKPSHIHQPHSSLSHYFRIDTHAYVMGQTYFELTFVFCSCVRNVEYL